MGNTGIYKWTNKETGNVYIGQAKDLKQRMRSFLRFNSRYAGCKIDEERKKYPSLMYWDYVVLEFCEESQLDSLEKKYINEYPNALNIMLVQKPKKEKKNRIKIRKGRRQNEKLELNFQSLYKIYKKKLDYVLNDENGCYNNKFLKQLIDIIHNDANKTEYNLFGYSSFDKKELHVNALFFLITKKYATLNNTIC